MWPTIDGLRVLRGEEADLVRRAIGEMIGELTGEWERDQTQRVYGVDWFDQWDVEQRIWLLEQVATALLQQDQPPPPTAAIYEASVDALFCHIVQAIAEEMDTANRIESDLSWRQGLKDAFRVQQGRPPRIDEDETEIRQWYSLATQVADTILGQTSYQRAEPFRDREAKVTERFLEQRALPKDYLQKIPPLRTNSETRTSLNALQDTIIRRP